MCDLYIIFLNLLLFILEDCGKKERTQGRTPFFFFTALLLIHVLLFLCGLFWRTHRRRKGFRCSDSKNGIQILTKRPALLASIINRNLPKHKIWCRVTIDGTDFRIGEPVPFNTKWKSPKAKGASVKYEVAVSIYSGDFVWIYGPHVGSKHDLTIFREQLRQLMDKDEMVETDARYRGEAEFIRNKHDFENDQEDKEKSELRARQETVNRRFKQWGILQERFRNDKNKHQMAFYAIATLTQMDIDKGNVLFSVGVTALQRKRNYKF